MDAKQERVKSTKEMGSRVKELREKKKMTQRQVATYVGIGQQSVAEIESGKTMDPKCIDKLASVLGVTPGWLRYGKEDDISPRSSYVAERIEGLPEKEKAVFEQLVDLVSGAVETKSELESLREVVALRMKHKKDM